MIARTSKKYKTNPNPPVGGADITDEAWVTFNAKPHVARPETSKPRWDVHRSLRTDMLSCRKAAHDCGSIAAFTESGNRPAEFSGWP